MPAPTLKQEPPVKKLADINPLQSVKCPSCGIDAFATFPTIVRTKTGPTTFELCGLCLTQSARQPVTFKLRFNFKSGDPIREILEKKDAVKI